jgi:hypothetical protein
MAPILGIWASGASAAAAVGDYESIATTTVGAGGVSSVTFSSIPSTYQHLQLRMLVRNTSTSNGYNARFNSDTGSNYVRHYLIGTGSSAVAAANFPATSMVLSDAAVSTSGTGVFGVSVCDVLDYQNANKNKVIRTLGGFDNNGGGGIILLSGLWLNTAAVNRIDLIPDAGNFAEYSSFALYGIKG